MPEIPTSHATHELKSPEQVKAELRSYIDQVTSVFRAADESIAVEPTLPFEVHVKEATDTRTLYGISTSKFGESSDYFVKKAIQTRYPERTYKDRYEYSNEADEKWRNGEEFHTDPIDRSYSRVRTRLASSWDAAADTWSDINPERYWDESDKDPSELSHEELRNLNSEQIEMTLEQQSKQYFHDVLLVDISDRADQNKLLPGGLLVIPSFENVNNGIKLAEATAKVIERLAQLASNPEVADILKNISPEDGTSFARHSGLREVEEDKINQNLNATTRLLTEAAATTAQLAGLMLANVKGEYDIADAVESLKTNGVFKLMALMPRGVIGPLAVQGTRWNSDVVLDQEKLAENEFALSDELRKSIIDLHTEVRSRLMGFVAQRGAHAHPELKQGRLPGGMGCPARIKDMDFIVDLIIKELKGKS